MSDDLDTESLRRRLPIVERLLVEAQDERTFWEHQARNRVQVEPERTIPMLIWCPECKARHIDVGEFATRVHHTHSCQSCGMTWRPAVVPTVGVQFLPGFKNQEAEDESSLPTYEDAERDVEQMLKDVILKTAAQRAAELAVDLEREAEAMADARIEAQSPTLDTAFRHSEW